MNNSLIKVNKKDLDINIDLKYATTDNFTTWQAGGFYAKGAIVKESGVFYRAKNNLTSGQTFSEDNWNKIGSTLPLKGGARIKKYKEFLQNEALYTYGTTLKTVQEVADFLYGYNRWLETQGFVFDEFSKELNLPMDWDLSTKEFLFWTTQNWAIGSVITLSPASAILKFKNPGAVTLISKIYFRFCAFKFSEINFPISSGFVFCLLPINNGKLDDKSPNSFFFG